MTKKQKEKLALALKEKGYWRVKELLQSYISSLEYDKETYFEYAKILHHYGDFVHSGKYFFLCDTSIEKYKKAIDIYLLRNTYQEILHDTPRQFKKLDINKYPKNLLTVILNDKKLKKNYYELYKKNKDKDNDNVNNVSDVIVISILVFILCVFTIGLFTTVNFVISFKL